jgi:hypothetical protein
MATEKRGQPRVRVTDMPAHLRHENHVTLGAVENLSLSGAFVRADETLPVDTVVRLRMVRPGMKQGLDLMGRVVSAIPVDEAGTTGRHGMGVRFEDLNSDTTGSLAIVLRGLGLHGGFGPEGDPAPFLPTRHPETAVSIANLQKVLASRDAELAATKRRLDLAEHTLEHLKLGLESERKAHATEIEKMTERHTRAQAELQGQFEKVAIELATLRRQQ